ncbi:response regulator [Roseovarius spongiae]|uniref:Response regulator n=1 Tax=Roseovarius spongiae TaxID=2320272 RepID=A0A3A8B5A1_9RHOB|nr:response regulator [Roseovarius spongiae]RKF14239.1 response regulator [Roseovarius spongiae]
MKILAVDDDPVILELLVEVLRVADFTNLTICESAKEALDLIAKSTVPFDCFLLDIQMPAMDGIQLTSAIRKLPQHVETPILMITAMSERTYIDSAFSAGASDYITKPFEIGEVHARLRLIEELVMQRKMRDDRNPVPPPRSAQSIATEDDFAKRLVPADIDGVIDYLALENYLLQISRISTFGMQAFGIVVPGMERMFLASSVFEYESAISDIAEAISDTLKPCDFFVAHAGAGEFVVVLTGGGPFDAQRYQHELTAAVEVMDLCYCDGRPLVVRPVVGDALSLQMKSSRGITNTLVQALANAESCVDRPREAAPRSSVLKVLFGA